MALSKEILEESDFAKSQLMNSNLDERCKKSMLRLLNTATESTNGIPIEEKIQKITEIVHGLILSQITFLDSVDKKIENANREKCKSCKAMTHAEEVELKEMKRKLIEDWKKANGITDTAVAFDGNVAITNSLSKDDGEKSWVEVIKEILTKPGIWVFLTLLTISPYGVDIVKALITCFGK